MSEHQGMLHAFSKQPLTSWEHTPVCIYEWVILCETVRVRT